MPNPSYYPTSVSSQVQHQEHVFDVYAYQQQAYTLDSNDVNVSRPLKNWSHNFGWINVMDWDIRDGDTTDAKEVARLQGLSTAAGKSEENWYTACNMLFTDGSFKGSTLSIQGSQKSALPAKTLEEGDWAVVGGTGQFVYAQGIVNYKKMNKTVNKRFITKLRIHIVCLTFPKLNPVQKVRPWGGEGGEAYEIQQTELPQRLQSITIYARADVIESIAFSYIDQAGQDRIVGPWGGDNGKSKHPVIELGSSETVKEIFGTITGTRTTHSRDIVVTSLGIVTNNKTYRYGKESSGNIYFKEAAPDNHNIVGFYGRVGDVVHQIGAYVA